MNTQLHITEETWKKFYQKNNYYHKDTQRLAKLLIPDDASLIEIGSKGGELLESLPNKKTTGIILNRQLLRLAKRTSKKTRFMNIDDFPKRIKDEKFDYILLSHTISEIEDVQDLLRKLKDNCHINTRIIVTYFNFLWKPLLDAAEGIGQRLPQSKEPNWLSEGDVDNFFYLENFDKVKSGKRFIIPYKIPIMSNFFNRYLAQLPFINSLCFTSYSIYRPKPPLEKYSVSIIVPARNEEGNIKGVLKKIPKFGKATEIIFVEGHSKDDTYKTIKKEIKDNKGSISARLYRQKGAGKGDAVRLGFSKAKHDLLMILDADLTVDPKELPKFYEAISSGKGDLVIGSRLIYPRQKQAMRMLNYLGNKFFSWAFTYLLGQKIKDTLCGTKVILKDNYKKIEKNRKMFGNFDPFGDFDLIFGAVKLNLKITEIPIRYKERTYGKTNISRFTHGLLLLKMVFFAAKNLKFI